MSSFCLLRHLFLWDSLAFGSGISFARLFRDWDLFKDLSIGEDVIVDYSGVCVLGCDNCSFYRLLIDILVDFRICVEHYPLVRRDVL